MIPIVAIIVLSVVLHEMAHGYAANWLGDPTARLQGRLSANPLVHLDLLGSIIIPALLVFSNSPFLFGWAKPVPYNPYNLNNQRWGEAIVAAAGPAVNILLAIIFAVLIRSVDVLGLSEQFLELALYVVFINVLLAMFNMLPFPPLDGSKVLMSVLPLGAQMQYRRFVSIFEQYGLFAMFAFIFLFVWLFGDLFFGFMRTIVELLTGVKMF